MILSGKCDDDDLFRFRSSSFPSACMQGTIRKKSTKINMNILWRYNDDDDDECHLQKLLLFLLLLMMTSMRCTACGYVAMAVAVRYSIVKLKKFDSGTT